MDGIVSIHQAWRLLFLYAVPGQADPGPAPDPFPQLTDTETAAHAKAYPRAIAVKAAHAHDYRLMTQPTAIPAGNWG